MLQPLNYRAGVIKDDTVTQAEGYAVDSQWIRHVRGKPQTKLGWEQASIDIAAGSARSEFAWVSNNGQQLQAIGTNKKLYAFVGAQLFNITPMRSNGTFGNNPFVTTMGSAVVTATLTDHGAASGDTVVIDGSAPVGGITPGGPSGTFATDPFTFSANSSTVIVNQPGHTMSTGDTLNVSGASAFGGITLDGAYLIYVFDADTYTIDAGMLSTASGAGGGTPTYAMGRAYEVTVVDDDTFTFTHIAAATSGATGGGSAANYLFEINIGNQDGLGGYGFGIGGFGDGPFGLGVIAALGLQPRVWALCNFGEVLCANPIGGGIYDWDLDVSQRAALITNAPAQANWICVTAERVLMAFGCTNLSDEYDPMEVRWTDSEDRTDWIPTTGNIAGDLRLGEGSAAISAVPTRGGIVVWSNTTAYFIQYVANPDTIYQSTPLGTCGICGPNAFAEYNGTVFWITPSHDFYTYAGGTPRPLRCPVREWFAERIEVRQDFKVFAIFDSAFPGIEFHYQTTDSATGDVNDYIRFDYQESASDPDAGWAVGTLDRTTGIDRGVFENPYAVDLSGLIYIMERGFNANGSALPKWIEYAPMELVTQTSKGDHLLNIRRIMVDAIMTRTLTVTITGRSWPNAPLRTIGIVAATPSTQYNDLRGQGRQIGTRFETFGDQDYWRLGDNRLDTSPGPPR